MATALHCSPTNALRTRSRVSALTTAELVLLARDGDQAAWDELVKRLEPVIRSVTRRHRLRAADAADVAQFTWLQLTRHLPRLHEPARVPGWVATTARHECLKLLRRSQREALVPASGDERDHHAGGDDPADAVLGVERRHTVRE